MNELIGKEVIVYSRYSFAPAKGVITDVSTKDRAYQVRFYPKDKGGPLNHEKHSGSYFYKQQCEFTGCKKEPANLKLDEVLMRLQECHVKELEAFELLLNVLKSFNS